MVMNSRSQTSRDINITRRIHNNKDACRRQHSITKK